VDAFTVDPSALLAAADLMSRFEQRVEQALAQLEGVEQRLGALWDGSGGAAQAGAQQQWAEGAAEMRQALVDLRKVAETAHENYHGAAQLNMRNWG